MTQLSFKIIKCPKCGTENKIVYYASINTIMDLDGSLIERLLEGTLNTSICHNCGVGIRLSLDVLINCPKGMVYLNPADDLEHKKQQLKAYGAMSEKGGVLSGPESMFLQAKKKLSEKEQDKCKPSPLPPPAPKITPHTRVYNEIYEEISKKLGRKKKSEKEAASESGIESPKTPPPPPPPPPSEK